MHAFGYLFHAHIPHTLAFMRDKLPDLINLLKPAAIVRCRKYFLKKNVCEKKRNFKRVIVLRHLSVLRIKPILKNFRPNYKITHINKNQFFLTNN